MMTDYQKEVEVLQERLRQASEMQMQHSNIPDLAGMPEGPERRFHAEMAESMRVQVNALYKMLAVRQQQIREAGAQQEVASGESAVANKVEAEGEKTEGGADEG